MITVALVLGALSLAGVVYLAFGYAASLKLIRELQDKLHDAAVAAAPRRLDRFAKDKHSFVLVSEEGCLACMDRITDLVRHIRANPRAATLSYTIVQADNGARPEVLPKAIEFATDPELAGALAVSVMPLGVVFDGSGAEVARSVLGDRQSLERMVTWAANRQEKSLTTPQTEDRGEWQREMTRTGR